MKERLFICDRARVFDFLYQYVQSRSGSQQYLAVCRELEVLRRRVSWDCRKGYRRVHRGRFRDEGRRPETDQLARLMTCTVSSSGPS